MCSQQAPTELTGEMNSKCHRRHDVCYGILYSERMHSLPVTLCWSASPVNVAALEAYGGILIEQCCLSQQPRGKHCHASCQSCICCLSYSQAFYYLVDTHLFTTAQTELQFFYVFAERNANLQLAYTFNNSTTEKLTKATMAVIDRVAHTYMTAGNHLELWLFSEESVLKMVQNNPAKCTFEPFRRDAEAERKTIIWLDCKFEEQIHRRPEMLG